MPPLATVACKRCGRQICWVRTESGHAMPIDPEPTEAGNVFVTKHPTGVRAAVASKKQPRPPGVAFMPHFATCPALNDSRRSKKPAKPPKPDPPPPPPELGL